MIDWVSRGLFTPYLGGKYIEGSTAMQDRVDAQVRAKEQRRQQSIRELASLSLEYFQMEEAIGRGPALREFGERRFRLHSEAVANTVEAAWQKYSEAIRSVIQSVSKPHLG